MKILIISEYIAPFQSIASVRWTKIAKYMKQQHPEVEITVLTNKKDYKLGEVTAQYVRKDELLEKELQYFDGYWEIPQDFYLKAYHYLKNAKNKGEAGFFARKKMTSTVSFAQKIRVICFDTFHDMKDKLWERQVRKSLSPRFFDFDIVISTYGPFWTHMVAKHIKDKNPDIIWLADFRDNYAGESDSPSAYKRHKEYTLKYCASADIIIRVIDELETFTPCSIPVHTVPNGFDPEERLDPMPPKKFSIVFTGMLYGTFRDIGIVGKAVSELCEEGFLSKNDVEIAYAGQHGDIARSLMAEYHAEGYIHDYGIVPRTHALKMQQYAAILLQLNWNTQRDKCGWSGKMYEYMMAQKPILYVVTGDVPYSAPSREIYHLGGCCYEQCRHEETYPQMKAYILKKYQEWKNTGNVSVQQDREYIDQYSYVHISQRIWNLMERSIEGKENGNQQ